MPEIYDHALLADKKLATHVNDLLEAGKINDRQAYMAWLLIAFCGKRYAASEELADQVWDGGEIGD
jgi:hypothetical protein